MTSSARDRPTVVRLLRETIVQLCRANAPFPGSTRVEIDGIICITGAASGQELVVKVHEVLQSEPKPTILGLESSASAAAAAAYPARLFARDPSDLEAAAVKRRRLDPLSSGFDHQARGAGGGFPGLLAPPPLPPPLRPHPSSLYDYLSRFGYGQHLTSRSTELESRLGVKDLSMKVSGRGTDAVETTARSSPPRRQTSPDLMPDTTDSRQHAEVPNRRPAIPPFSGDQWPPTPQKPIPAIPQCFVCGLRFDSAELLGEHNESVHSIFTCFCCFKTFTSRSNLERHSRLHTGHRPYACTVCGKTFSRKDHLSNHATKHAYKCGTCTRRCADRAALAEHYRLDHPGSTLAAVCTFCNKGFCSIELYEEHVKVHPQFHVPSDDPGSSTQDRSSAARHRCQMCGYEAMDRVCLVQHQQLAHYAPTAPSLLFQSDPYDAGSPLRRLDVAAYRCAICGYAATSLHDLHQHETLHIFDMSTPRPSSSVADRQSKSPLLDLTAENNDGEASRSQGFECSHCGIRFDTYSNLCVHMQDVVGADTSNDVVLIAGQHRDKRKQKQPKPVVTAEIDDDEVVNVVSPESSEENGKKTMADFPLRRRSVDRETEDKCHEGGSTPVRPGNPGEIRMEPIRSIMNRSSLLNSKARDIPQTDFRSLATSTQPAAANSYSCAFGDIADFISSRIVKTEIATTPSEEPGDLSFGENPTSRTSGNSPSPYSSPDDLTTNNNNNNIESGPSLKSESPWNPSSAALSELNRCVVCGLACADFSELEAHCLNEHSRSPCMYCDKTFAQKANRDRHMCLHTGDRPYRCPECDERFSRGDKLKLHRVRTHGVLYPLYGSRGGHRDGSTSRNHSSTSQSPLTVDPDSEAAHAYASDLPAVSANFNGSLSSTGQNHSPSLTSHLLGSTSVLSAGEWVDLRISLNREQTPSKFTSTWPSADALPSQTFPKRETPSSETDVHAVGGNL